MNQDPLKINTNFYEDVMSADGTGDLDDPAMRDAEKPPDIESYVLAVISMWLDKMTPVECENLAARNFSYETLVEYAVERINKSKLEKVCKNKGGSNLELSKRVVTAVNSMKNLKPCPRFLIPPEEVEFIPGLTTTGDTSVDENAVAARLESLEKNHEIAMKALNDIQKNIKYPSAVASVPAVELQTFPSLPLPAAGAQNSFADRQQTPKIGQVHAIRERLLSTASNMSGNGTKRNRDEAKIDDRNESWAKVAGRGGRKKPKVRQGNSRINIAAGEEVVLPFDVYIGNTHPRSTKDVVKRYLKECYEAAPDDEKAEGPFEVLKIECCTKPRDDGKDPWCLNWRVSVDQRFREYILKPEAIPMGWTSRRYFPPRAKRPPPAELHPAKIANTRETPTHATAAQGAHNAN